jgi:LysM domain
VGDRDTLTSVAARFDTTPSELKALNHLGGSFIYSGQTLLVPDKTKQKDDDCSSETSGDTDGMKDKSRKSSSNTDDIPQQEKGRRICSLLLFLGRFFQGQHSLLPDMPFVRLIFKLAYYVHFSGIFYLA